MQKDNNKNFLLAIALSIGVLILWQFFYAGPRMEEEQARLKKQQEAAQQQQRQANAPGAQPAADGTPKNPSTTLGAPPQLPGTRPVRDRKAVINETQRVAIDTPSLKGSINLTGGRIDDITLKNYRETVEKDSPQVTVLAPSGSEKPFYAEHGWLGQNVGDMALPGAKTQWKQTSSGPLTPSSPLELEFDNGKGLIFRRTISVDDKYMFTLKREVENTTGKPITLFPFALLSRHVRPPTAGFFILHEGLVGVLGEEEGWQEITYDDAVENPAKEAKAKGGWLGITDKYWAASLIPDQKLTYKGRLSGSQNGSQESFQTDYLLDPITIEAGKKTSIEDRVFAGAKQVGVIESYEDDLKIFNFSNMIDWGWFYFLTIPLNHALDYVYKIVGNFGISILIVTLFIKLLLFPLANKAYVSMSRMKKLQPEVKKLQDRYKDDKMKQQQEMMALYKKEKVNPLSGCLPILVQIPIFFALYKVLFVSIDMRHAPFYGWIQDLSAPDPTTIFNLFGLIPWDPPSFLMIGIWPIIMGITMWVQMKLNPAQPDPVQQQIFAWMPVMFTFLLATFPAGLVIYWAWNNFLSVLQQYWIMRNQGVDVDLLENMGIAQLFRKGGDKKTEKS